MPLNSSYASPIMRFLWRQRTFVGYPFVPSTNPSHLRGGRYSCAVLLKSYRFISELIRDSNVDSSDGNEIKMMVSSTVDGSNMHPPPTSEQLTESDLLLYTTKLRKVITDSSGGPVILPRNKEDEVKVVTAPIPGADSVVVLVSDDIVQMVQQNSQLMRHTLIRDARDAKVTVNPSENELMDIPLITYRARTTYFQFDYRNHDTPITESMQGLLRKIEATLENTDLEPFGKNRGLETMRQNITNLGEGEGYRIKNRSLNKSGSIEPVKKFNLNLNRYALMKLLKERHCIYATGVHERFGQLDFVELGRSFFGPDSDVEVRGWEAEEILSELWFRGTSSRFRGLQRRHFALLRRKKAKIRKEELILAILNAANVDVSNRLKKKAIFKQMKAALRDPADASKEVQAILEAAKKMNIGFNKGKLRSTANNHDITNIEEISNGDDDSDSEATEDFMDEICDDQVHVETSDAISIYSRSDSHGMKVD
jgi:hypothetical protein